MFWRIIIAICLISGFVLADQNQMEPLPSELLSNPIYLDCGLTIREWRGKREINKQKLNKFCNLAKNNFPKFLNKKNLRKEHDLPFVWNASFIPEANCYRCLNDMKNRFLYRKTAEYLTGWTYFERGYLFVATDSPDFNVILVHELYHAMSNYYGVFHSAETDERLAREFTHWLGLGI